MFISKKKFENFKNEVSTLKDEVHNLKNKLNITHGELFKHKYPYGHVFLETIQTMWGNWIYICYENKYGLVARSKSYDGLFVVGQYHIKCMNNQTYIKIPYMDINDPDFQKLSETDKNKLKARPPYQIFIAVDNKLVSIHNNMDFSNCDFEGDIDWKYGSAINSEQMTGWR